LFDDQREEFGDKQMGRFSLSHSESDWRATLVTFLKSESNAGSNASLRLVPPVKGRVDLWKRNKKKKIDSELNSE